MRWIKIADIGNAPNLTADQRIELLSTAIQELGIAHGLVLIHGADRGAQRYAELRTRVRFIDGEPAISVQ